MRGQESELHAISFISVRASSPGLKIEGVPSLAEESTEIPLAVDLFPSSLQMQILRVVPLSPAFAHAPWPLQPAFQNSSHSLGRERERGLMPYQSPIWITELIAKFDWNGSTPLC
jgi:hypothetical protein